MPDLETIRLKLNQKLLAALLILALQQHVLVELMKGMEKIITILGLETLWMELLVGKG